MKHPQKKRNINSHVNDGDNAAAIPNKNRNEEEPINAILLPNVSVINPQIGDAMAIAKNTAVVSEATPAVLIFQELHCKAGPSTDNIIISIESDK